MAYTTLRDDWLYGNFRTRMFSDIFPDAQDFQQQYRESGFAIETIPDYGNALTELYYCLYAQYGNSHIANADENQFRYRVFSLIYQYAPNWSRRRQVQVTIRDMTEDQLRESAQAIYNHSFNPSTAPSTQTTDELETINDQNVTKHKRSRTDAYALLMDLLDDSFTARFIARFKPLFITVVEPENPLWYVTKLEEDE